MFELRSNMEKKYDRSIPNINFDNQEMLWNMVNLMNVDMNIYQYLGLLMLRLGFEPEDNILLCNYNKDDCSFDCVLDNKECYRVKFNFPDNEIVVGIHNVKYGYKCEPLEYTEIGMRVSLGSYSYDYADGMVFTRYLSRKDAKFVVSICDYILELEVKKPDDINLPLFDENGNYAKYKLDNEEDLIKYLSFSKVFCKSISDIYKELCEIYLSDVSKYPEFSLKRSRLCEDGTLKVIDLIHLKYGELQKFGMTTYDRTLFLDKDDNWSYEMSADGNVPVNFLMSSQNGMVSCMFSAMEDYDLTKDYIHTLVKQDINVAMNEVIKSKRKVRETFRKDSK